MKKNTINISINDKNENRNQIIYNNVLDSMDKKSMSKEEQLEYLKYRITYLENCRDEKKYYIICSIIFLLFLSFGLFLILQNYVFLGILIVICSFFINMYLTYKISKKFNKEKENSFEEIETIRKIIDSKLK